MSDSNFKERELEILRAAVDRAETKSGKQNISCRCSKGKRYDSKRGCQTYKGCS